MTESGVPQALAEQRRERMRSLMDRLEAALAEPARRDMVAWTAAIGDIAAGIAAEFDAHVAATEGPGGLFEEIGIQAPRLRHLIDRLSGQHPHLRSACADLRAVVECDPDDEQISRARAIGSALLLELISHRQLGADLLYEAYWVDVATSD
jgi:hypothetical protein